MSLAAQSRTTQVSEPVTPVDPAPSPVEDTSSLASLHAGRVIGGRYTLSSRVAIGGMGEVWRAYDESAPDAIALKILRPELAGQQLFLSRLRIEAANASTLHHPNLAQVYDSGEEEGLGWIAMELVEGTPLTQILADNPRLPIDFLLSVMMQTANALDTVHRAGIVHRDIKPGNIMVTPQGMVKLTDFGISRATNQVTLTAAGMVMGTAQYLPPEQAVGNPATPVGDLYALGVIAYESLAGQRPFTGKRQVDIAFAHVNKPVPALPADVPKPLAELVMSLLEKDPRHRPASALELGDRIEQVMVQLGISFARRPEDVEAAAEAAKQADEAAQAQARAISEAEECDVDGGVDASIEDTHEDTEAPPRAHAVSVEEIAPVAMSPLDDDAAPVVSDDDARDRLVPLEADGSPMTSLAGGTVPAPDIMPDSIMPTVEELARRRAERLERAERAIGSDVSDTTSRPVEVILDAHLLPSMDKGEQHRPAPAPSAEDDPSVEPQADVTEAPAMWPALRGTSSSPMPTTWSRESDLASHSDVPAELVASTPDDAARHCAEIPVLDKEPWLGPLIAGIVIFVLTFLGLTLSHEQPGVASVGESASLSVAVTSPDTLKESPWLMPLLNV
ncbi:serine/threonine protein kinase [Nanchangia anserum]|uniref:non-specific serine/threonine protein kinase n=1 Tax=Nanchangia anserum TaxID=2692125 RepID=A0A8I0GGW6_9ACTO|nr:serine/threonine-protein kinase [Nanchangia anserum]MBD3689794.1 serine/threonine protein kinase [Nanchangia anserum]QOX81968.1 serine/threonine protein kinase [Nanchangia anserum]